MKNTLLVSALISLISVASAFADTSTKSTLYRFDVECKFDHEYKADSRIYLKISDDETIQEAPATWYANLLSVKKDDTLIYAGTGLISHNNMGHDVHWEIYSENNGIEIDLKDHPFSVHNRGHENNVDAKIKISQHHEDGHCKIKPSEVDTFEAQ